MCLLVHTSCSTINQPCTTWSILRPVHLRKDIQACESMYNLVLKIALNMHFWLCATPLKTLSMPTIWLDRNPEAVCVIQYPHWESHISLQVSLHMLPGTEQNPICSPSSSLQSVLTHSYHKGNGIVSTFIPMAFTLQFLLIKHYCKKKFDYNC